MTMDDKKNSFNQNLLSQNEQPRSSASDSDIQMNAEAKLLAHALNEQDVLSEADQTEIESQMANDPDAKAFVEEIRQIGQDLKTALTEDETQLEPSGVIKSLTEARLSEQANEEDAMSAKKIKPTKDRELIRFSWFQFGMVASLGLVLTIIFLPVLGKARQSARSLARSMASEEWYEESEDSAHGSVSDDAIFDPIESPAVNIHAQQALTHTPLDSTTSPSTLQSGRELKLPSRRHGEAYDGITHNPFLKVTQAPLSTFSIDVDTASYANVRRFLSQGQLPPPGAVRLEEMINYFDYEDKAPDADSKHPFAVHMEVNQAPWQKTNRLIRIGIKGRVIDDDKRPACNLVFLLDVSGSMSDHNKLPLVKQSLKLLLSTLNEKDRVAIVVYAGSSGLVLESTPASDRHKIMESLNRLNAGGSTNGGEGIRLAYQIAAENFIDEGVNRVILATDGDFNVGTTNRSDLERLIERNRESGISLSILGFGMGNYKDGTMESLSNKGNGNYAYIDTIHEAQKSLVDQASGTLVTIAKDVKIQVEFNPAHVTAYRLIGYENRMLRKEDFNNDKIDAGDIGAGHHVTALYEIVPAGQPIPVDTSVDPLKYQKPAAITSKEKPQADEASHEMLTLKLRYKQPNGNTSTKLELPLVDPDTSPDDASRDFKFAAAVANFGMLLRGSPYRGDALPNQAAQLSISLGTAGKGRDTHGYRAEFINLVRKTLPLLRLLEMEAEPSPRYR